MAFDWPPYVPVAERRKKAASTVAKLLSKGEKVSPLIIEGRTIAKTFWGKAWCDHLESFSDFENRLPRGRTYARNGSVIHLSIESGKIKALVQGSSLYKVEIGISSVKKTKWQLILKSCSGKIDSVIELLQGKLSSGVMKAITDQQEGLFPHPKEISLKCSCPDWADMCKHVAAVLYGVGARLDNGPELLFKLRQVDHLELINNAGFKAPSVSNVKVIHGQNLSDLFGIDIITDQDISKKITSKKVTKKKVSKKSAKKKIK